VALVFVLYVASAIAGGTDSSIVETLEAIVGSADQCIDGVHWKLDTVSHWGRRSCDDVCADMEGGSRCDQGSLDAIRSNADLEKKYNLAGITIYSQQS
jgi:hypothetical protein